MSLKEEHICRFCFAMVETECEVIDIVTREILDVLLLKLNIDVSKNPVACNNCTKIIKRCYTFKVNCLDREMCTTDCDKDYIKCEQNGIKGAENVENGSEMDLNRCQICKKGTKVLDCMTMSAFLDELQFSELLAVYFPQDDFSAKSTICISCKDNIELYLKFAHDCLVIEEKINEYRQHFGSTDTLNLSDIQTFYNSESMHLNHTKKESGQSEVDFLKYSVKNEAVDNEEENLNTVDDTIEKFNDLDEVAKTPNENASATKLGKTLLKCEACNYETFKASNLKRHLEIHAADSERKRFYCTVCPFTAVAKQTLARHMTTHDENPRNQPTTFKCTKCIFETKYKKNIQEHMIFVHKTETVLKMFKCDFCSYETARKHVFQRHMITHKSREEVEIYKCDSCAYETIHQSYFKTHKLTHGDISEVQKYKCGSCSYETIRKSNLVKHMIKHKDVSKVEVYKCVSCKYTTKYKAHIKSHQIIHKDQSEVKHLKCSVCDYRTKWTYNMNRHMNKHVSSAENV